MNKLFRADTTGVFKLDELQKQKIERKAANIPANLAPLGERIRGQRKRMGLARGEMARRLGCTEGHLLEIELGSIDIGFDLLDKIAHTTGCTLQHLLLGEEPSYAQRQLLEMAAIWSKNRPLQVSEILGNLRSCADAR